jgi:zinc and cadmium transporter
MAQVLLFLFIPVIISGLLVFLLKSRNRRTLKLILAFSGSYLFALSVTHLLPEVYASADQQIGFFVLGGFFLQILLEYLSEGIEHGHIHVHSSHHHSHSSFPVAVVLGLCIHAFMEGMPLSSQDRSITTPLLMGIVLHNLPVSFAFMSMLLESGISKAYAVFLLVVFALMSPLGALCSMLFFGDSPAPETAMYMERVMAIVIGIFLHISTTILFESSEDHRFNLYKFATIIGGAAVAVAV